MALSLHIARSAEIGDWLESLAALRIRVFREFPYLYEGSADYEARYLGTYVRGATSMAVLALDGERVVGASTGIALAEEEPDFQRPFLNAGIPVDEVFYCAESVLLPEYRGQGIYRHFFAAREAHARALPGMRLAAFCAVERPADHPRRPADWRPLDPVWARFGYRRAEHLRTTFSWRDLDEAEASPKPMVFYLKPLHPAAA